MAFFSGLNRTEIAQLSPAARDFAETANRARRAVPIQRAIYLLGTKLLDLKLPIPASMPWLLIALPLALIMRWGCRCAGNLLCSLAAAKLEAARPRALVLWLRKFHQHRDNPFPIHQLFENLSSWGVLACTLSDDVVYKSTLADNAVREWALRSVEELPESSWMRFVHGTMNFVVVSVAFLGLPAILLGARDSSGSIQTCLAIAYLLAAYFLALWARRSLTHLMYSGQRYRTIFHDLYAGEMAKEFTVTGAAAEGYFDGMSDDFRRQLKLERGYLAIVVPDADWQSVVQAAVRHSSAILVDVTQLSENLKWELSHLRDAVGMERLVLMFGLFGDLVEQSDWENHPSVAVLDSILGLSWRHQCQIFCFPQEVGSERQKLLAKNYMHHLAAKIYEAVTPPRLHR